MTTIRVAERNRYTAVDRRTINDDTLSFRARGILVWLLDKPDGWRIDSDQIAAAAKEGRDAVRTALNELARAGYIVRRKAQDAKGRWTSETLLYERPQTITAGQTEDGFPGPGSPTPGNPAVGQPGPIPKTVNEDCERTLSLLPRPGGVEGAVDESFGRWWEQWPNKARGGKGNARRHWRRMKPAEREAAFEGLRRHAEWWTANGTDPQFIPAGDVWLNQRRWEDDEPKNRPSAPEVEPEWVRASKARRAAGGNQT